MRVPEEVPNLSVFLLLLKLVMPGLLAIIMSVLLLAVFIPTALLNQYLLPPWSTTVDFLKFFDPSMKEFFPCILKSDPGP